MKNVIYGASVYGEIFCKEMEANNKEVEFFIDEYTDKKSLSNKSIKRLKEISLVDINIFISITTPVVEVKVIKNLKRLGVINIYSFEETLQVFPNLLKECVKFSKMWYSPTKKEMINYHKFNDVKKLLKDEKSVKLLDSILKFRENLSPEQYLIPDLEPQYFPKDINLFRHIEKIRFIDVGAFIGDTLAESIVEFERVNKEVEYIISFEPDKVNIDKLSSEIKKQKYNHPDIDFFIYPCGLWSSNEILHFNANSNSNSSIVEKMDDNTISIMTVTLDKTLIGAIPNYIKMDTEGAEREAILGAREIISKYSPVLAISIYHKPHDVWDLPLLINKINPNYDMYLRIYGNMGLELVLYCVPKNV